MASSLAGEFQTSALWVARSFRKLSVSELADKAGYSRQLVSGVENGTVLPTPDCLEALSVALKFPARFFFTIVETPNEGVLHLRSKKRVSARAIDHARAHAALFDVVADAFHSIARFRMPKLREAEIDGVNAIEDAADDFRKCVGLRLDAPIGDAIQTVEAAGVLVGLFDPLDMPLDGFASANRALLIMLNCSSPWSRRRFSVMHEAFHLIAHRDRPPADELELEANRFAGAVLAPRAAFWREFPRPSGKNFNWSSLVQMKQRWGLSLQALIQRAWELGIITAVQRRRAFVHISSEGWRTREPGELEPEVPTVAHSFISDVECRYGRARVANEASLFRRNVLEALGLAFLDREERSGIVDRPL